MEKLTSKQEIFCREFVIDFNATRAYLAAGYTVKSKDTAAANASRLLRNAKVESRLRELKQEIADRLEITRERVASEFARIGFSDATALFKDDGTLKKFSELTEDERKTIASVESDEISVEGVRVGVRRKIKMHDKLGALNSLAKMFGYNEPDRFKGELDLTGAMIVFR